jgi:phospholipid transport system substrate-binding protein
MQRLFRLTFLTALILTPLVGLAESGPQSAPAVLVDTLQGALVRNVSATGDAGYARRFQHLRPVVTRAHHFDLIARVVMGRKWRDLNEEQRAGFVERLTTLAVANYAGKFDGGQGHFVFDAEQSLAGGQALVRTRLIREGKEDVRFDYVLAPGADEQWGIVNTVVDGVSDLAIKRSEYQELLTNEGFAALLREMENRIEEAGGRPPEAG